MDIMVADRNIALHYFICIFNNVAMQAAKTVKIYMYVHLCVCAFACRGERATN